MSTVEAGDIQREEGATGVGSGGGAAPEHHIGAPLEGIAHKP